MTLVLAVDDALSTDWRAVAGEAEVAHVLIRVVCARSDWNLSTVGALVCSVEWALSLVCSISAAGLRECIIKLISIISKVSWLKPLT